MNNKSTYKKPEIKEITLDKDISVHLASSDSLPPTGVGDETATLLFKTVISDPFKSHLG